MRRQIIEPVVNELSKQQVLVKYLKVSKWCQEPDLTKPEKLLNSNEISGETQEVSNEKAENEQVVDKPRQVLVKYLKVKRRF